jgi:hypothetical protein
MKNQKHKIKKMETFLLDENKNSFCGKKEWHLF